MSEQNPEQVIFRISSTFHTLSGITKIQDLPAATLPGYAQT
jgi:hypothetical protein